MKIIIVTGFKGVGKSTYLKELINDDFDGVITICKDRKIKKYEFFLIKENKSLLCCHYDNGMNFNESHFEKVNDYLLALQPPKERDTEGGNIVIDEIGWLELEEKGLYRGFKSLLMSENIDTLYVSMRYDIHKELIEKFNIVDYDLVVL